MAELHECTFDDLATAVSEEMEGIDYETLVKVLEILFPGIKITPVVPDTSSVEMRRDQLIADAIEDGDNSEDVVNDAMDHAFPEEIFLVEWPEAK